MTKSIEAQGREERLHALIAERVSIVPARSDLLLRRRNEKI